MTKKEIDDIIKKVKDKTGEEVLVRDIGFAILAIELADDYTAFRCVYGNKTDYTIRHYLPLEQIKYMRELVEAAIKEKRSSMTIVPLKGAVSNEPEDAKEDISFEENKAALLRLLDKIKDAESSGELEKKDALKMEADVRTRLNDKFGASEKDTGNVVVVEPKFNYICPHTRKECYIHTKEECMKRYKLIEKEDGR